MLTSQLDGSKLTLRLEVESLDAGNAASFKQELATYDFSKLTQVILVMSAVSFVDSSGVGALLSLQKRLPPTAGNLNLKGTNTAVVGVIELLRLNRVFKLV
ncbi:MAG: STAS domain-containing protein [Verrucomicrobiota bacterium]|nr:STAS domain-containing protein [Verrucomicrobiota bacterium]